MGDRLRGHSTCQRRLTFVSLSLEPVTTHIPSTVTGIQHRSVSRISPLPPPTRTSRSKISVTGEERPDEIARCSRVQGKGHWQTLLKIEKTKLQTWLNFGRIGSQRQWTSVSYLNPYRLQHTSRGSTPDGPSA